MQKTKPAGRVKLEDELSPTFDSVPKFWDNVFVEEIPDW